MSKYIDADLLRKEIERRIKELDEQIVDIYDSKAVLRKDELQRLLSFLDTLPEQPVEGPEENLKKEISRTYFDGSVADTSNMDHNDYEGIARYFAEWQKKRDDLETADMLAIAHLQGMEQQKSTMLEDAVEGIARPDDCEIWVNLVGYGYKFKDGDKVRVIVIKEDEK